MKQKMKNLRLIRWKEILEKVGVIGGLRLICQKIKKFIVRICVGESLEKRVCQKSRSKYFILNEWQKSWIIGSALEGCGKEHFYWQFIKTYVETYQKKMRSKQKNFIWKTIFVLVLIAGFSLCAGYYWKQFLLEKAIEMELSKIIKNGVFLFLLILICGAVAKWLDVKKFQETWARHSKHLHLLDKEMCLFIYQLEPYDSFYREQIFISRILHIWDKNRKRQIFLRIS